MELTDIQNFYENKTILVTGSTGLVGKVLVEKLLRSCSKLNKIIVTIRPKRTRSTADRMVQYFDDTLFDSIRNDKPELLNKILFVTSDLEENCCGMNDVDYNFVKSSVNVVFHCAANVGFKALLRDVIRGNIISTKNILNLAKDMEHLQVFVHVSTLFLQGYEDITEEKVVNLTYSPEFFINLVHNTTEELLTKITPALVGNWPNTYLPTKNVAEHLIEREKDNLPVVIFRCPAVTSTYREPLPGWLNSIQGVTGLGIGLATGTVKVVYANSNYKLDIVPVDMIVNCMIAVAWDKGRQSRNTELKVFNYSCITNPLSRKMYFDAFINTPYPLESTTWTPGYVATSNKSLFNTYFTMYHTLPTIISDTFLKMFGKKPVFGKVLARSTKLMDAVAFFILKDFKIEFKNVPALWYSLSADDRKLFNFDVNSIDWNEYLKIFAKSAKTILNEDFDNLDKCHERRYLLRCKF